MASNNSVWDNANWWNTSSNAGDAGNKFIDPFNFSGWNKQNTPFTEAQPDRPAYSAAWDPSMAFAPELQSRLNGINLNTAGLDKFRGEAMRNGPSTWANLAQAQNQAQSGISKDKAVTEARSGDRTAEADLASKGGLSSGAEERIARGGAKNLLAVGQDNARQTNLNSMQIGINDEQNRISQLGQLPAMENTAFQDSMQKENSWDTARMADINAASGENQRRNSYNQNVYNQQMQAWAASKQANATENAGKK